jgi:hypothetical protein
VFGMIYGHNGVEGKMEKLTFFTKYYMGDGMKASRLSVSLCSQFFHFLCGPRRIKEPYEFTLLCVCVSVYHLIFFVSYAVRVVSKESRRLVLPRTSYSQCYHNFCHP